MRTKYRCTLVFCSYIFTSELNEHLMIEEKMPYSTRNGYALTGELELRGVRGGGGGEEGNMTIITYRYHRGTRCMHRT